MVTITTLGCRILALHDNNVPITNAYLKSGCASSMYHEENIAFSKNDYFFRISLRRKLNIRVYKYMYDLEVIF